MKKEFLVKQFEKDFKNPENLKTALLVSEELGTSTVSELIKKSIFKSSFENFDWTIINMDGINVGISDSFNDTYLEFHNWQDAILTIYEWNAFIRGDL